MHLPHANIRSPSYYIAHTAVRCAHCGQWTGALAVALPPSHEVLIDDEWQAAGVNAFLFHVVELPKNVSRLLQTSRFRLARSAEQPDPHWANHCEHCDALLGDDELHCEPGGFMPADADEAQGILLSAVTQPFQAVAAGYAADPAFFDHMGRR